MDEGIIGVPVCAALGACLLAFSAFFAFGACSLARDYNFLQPQSRVVRAGESFGDMLLLSDKVQLSSAGLLVWGARGHSGTQSLRQDEGLHTPVRTQWPPRPAPYDRPIVSSWILDRFTIESITRGDTPVDIDRQARRLLLDCTLCIDSPKNSCCQCVLMYVPTNTILM